MSVRALIFDFDGLILDTETPAYQAWAEIYREHGYELPIETWLDYIGRESGWFDALAHLESLAGPLADREAVRARRNARRLELVTAATEAEGLRELLAAARRAGLKLAVATSSRREWVGEHIDRLGLTPLFDHLQFKTDELAAKPAPDLYLAACAALGVRPDEAIAIEDSRHGIAGAKSAGLRCVCVPNGLTALMDLSAADLRCASLREVPLAALLEEDASPGR